MRSTVQCSALQYHNEMILWIAMLGGLHMELTALKTAVYLPESSGWTAALVQAGVATSGKASHTIDQYVPAR